MNFTIEWKGQDVDVYCDSDDVIVKVDGRQIFDHEFEHLSNEKYFELFREVESLINEKN